MGVVVFSLSFAHVIFWIKSVNLAIEQFIGDEYAKLQQGNIFLHV